VLQEFCDKVISVSNTTFMYPSPTAEDPFRLVPHEGPFPQNVMLVHLSSLARYPVQHGNRNINMSKSADLGEVLKVAGKTPPPARAIVRLDISRALFDDKNITNRDFYRWVNTLASSSSKTATADSCVYPFENAILGYSPQDNMLRVDYPLHPPLARQLVNTIRRDGRFGTNLGVLILNEVPGPNVFYMVPTAAERKKADFSVSLRDNFKVLETELPKELEITRAGVKDQTSMVFKLRFKKGIPNPPPLETLLSDMALKLSRQRFTLFESSSLGYVRFPERSRGETGGGGPQIRRPPPQSHASRSPPGSVGLSHNEALLLYPRRVALDEAKTVAALAGDIEFVEVVQEHDPYGVAQKKLKVQYKDARSAVLATLLSVNSVHTRTRHTREEALVLLKELAHVDSVPEGNTELQKCIFTAGIPLGAAEAIDRYSAGDHLSSLSDSDSDSEDEAMQEDGTPEGTPSNSDASEYSA
jgi:hypothetical protein